MTSILRARRLQIIIRIQFIMCTGVTLCFPSFAIAIPSPELVIGSVSSLSQVFAVLFATISGAGAVLAKRFGIQINPSNVKGRYPIKLITILIGLLIGFIFLNYWQYSNQKYAYETHLQNTLIRPAQFSGTTILDSNLVETSFSKQTKKTTAISTDEAEEFLKRSRTDSSVQFYDIRETGEHSMGSLPGATHIRFPDFPRNDPNLAKKKIVLFCHNGNRSSETCEALNKLGIDCSFIAGGIEKWIVEGRDFSDKSVKNLSDLRAIPEYPNKDTLLGTSEFKDLSVKSNIQIVDTRYPKSFASGHLPNAINIPIRAMKSADLVTAISKLDKRPTIAACYDRRSCFMAQVLGLELSKAGIDFQGRYTTPWEYFVAPKTKPHVEEWLAAQNTTFWQTSVQTLAKILLWIGERSHLVVAIILLSITSRILVLPITLKSERDQLVTRAKSKELEEIKTTLKDDPQRKARAISHFYKENDITPMRNLTALLFLPIMMLGLSAVEKATIASTDGFLWMATLGVPDHTYLLPLIFCALAGVYLHWAVSKSKRQSILWLLLGVPVLFLLAYRLSAGGNIYLCSSMILLLLQRSYVVGSWPTSPKGIFKYLVTKYTISRDTEFNSLLQSDALCMAGNKAYRLAVLKENGLPVPSGVVLQTTAINNFENMSKSSRNDFVNKLSNQLSDKPHAVRSSAASEDGEKQSFAGVFESVLDVTKDDLAEAISTVIASFSSTRANSYKDEQNDIDHDGNILIQEMINADYAGVLFTQNPTAPGLAMVEMVKGCGEDLVSGRVTPETYQYGRFSKAIFGETQPIIDIQPLIHLADQVEAIFGCPQDIEWAYSDKQFYIVQSRDITTLSSNDRAEQHRLDEWNRVFERYGSSKPSDIILEQDEMSEVLVQPTKLSFSLMENLWKPGGSLDLASRSLGVSYGVPEGTSAHLETLFGRTYINTEMKNLMALKVTNSKSKQLNKVAKDTVDRFENDYVTKLRTDISYWNAIDFKKLPQAQIKECIEKIHTKFVKDAYLEAEKINILASFTLKQAQSFTKENPEYLDALMNPHLPAAPSSIIDRCNHLKENLQKDALIKEMGHRSLYDYELSLPRYDEAPDLLWPLLTHVDQPRDLTKFQTHQIIEIAHDLQNLKELAKHEALRYLAVLRKAINAYAEKLNMVGDIYNLTFEELFKLTDDNSIEFRKLSKARKKKRKHLLKTPPMKVKVSLQDLEKYSEKTTVNVKATAGEKNGLCVSGSRNASGRVYRVIDETGLDMSVFDDFVDGDILVCRSVSPNWLPYMQRSGAVLCEIGGWLSHMAIVAREKDIIMLVSCENISDLETGMIIDVNLDGCVCLKTDKSEIKKTA